MGTVSKVFMLLIPLVILLVVLAILFRPEEGLFNKAKGLILGAKDVLPNVSVGLEEQKAEVTISDNHRAQIVSLGNTINSMLGEGKENCFGRYEQFSELGEKGTSLTFELQGDKTLLTVHGGAGGKQTIPDLPKQFPGMKPCVVAGPGEEAAHFVSHFIKGEELIYPYYSPVSSLTIFTDPSVLDENSVRVPELELKNDLDDRGWLFTPDGQYVCFFPTNDFNNDGEDGIGKAKFTLSGFFVKKSVPYRINQGELQQCS